MSFTNCSGQNSNPGTFTPVPQKISIIRFDKDLHQYLKNPTQDNLRGIQIKYKDFLPAFGRITINNSDSYKPEFYTRIQQYFSNQILSRIYTDALNKFEDITPYETELTNANLILMEEYPDKNLPFLYMHVSGFKENAMVVEGVISISIDKYLGVDYPVYKQFFEDFQLLQMQPKMIVRDYLRAWLLSDILPADKKNPHLLDQMIKEGKILYALSKLLPDWNPEDLLGYTTEQLTWCRENEKNIWKVVVEKNHLYEQDYQIINRYMNDAAFTAPLTPDSPGRVGAWLGWQIVNAYVTKNNTSLSQLSNVEAQQILKSSGYNP